MDGVRAHCLDILSVIARVVFSPDRSLTGVRRHS
jgi:hypothetical protein